MTSAKLTELVRQYNEEHPPEFNLVKRGSSSVDLPLQLMCSFFQPLFGNIKSKVEQLIE